MGVTRRSVFFQWQLSSFFGWGVYGINLMRYLGEGGFFSPITTVPFQKEFIEVLEEDRREIEALLEASISFQNSLSMSSGQVVTIDSPVLHALGINLRTLSASAHDVQIRSKQMVGVTFFERAQFSSDLRERMKSYLRIVTGSRWNADLLREEGVDHVTRVIQGIDTRIFCPRPPGGDRRDRFVVFSGGKIERRKGQDLVLRAFRAFHQRHDDARLAVAWHSPWPNIALGEVFTETGISSVPAREDGGIDVVGWAVANGIPADAIIDHGLVPNRQMAEIYRGVDVALFPNRAEGGTNLVAMEAMACGVPAVLSANTGHLDLIYPGACLPLTRQGPVTREGARDWGESDVEEMVEALEVLYQDRQRARMIGAAGADLMKLYDWRNQICQLQNELIGAFGI